LFPESDITLENEKVTAVRTIGSVWVVNNFAGDQERESGCFYSPYSVLTFWNSPQNQNEFALTEL